MNLKQLPAIYSKLNGLLPSNSSLVITRDSVLLRSRKSWFGQKTLLWYEHKCNGWESGPSTRGSIGWGWFPATSSTPPPPPPPHTHTHTHTPPPPTCPLHTPHLFPLPPPLRHHLTGREHAMYICAYWQYSDSGPVPGLLCMTRCCFPQSILVLLRSKSFSDWIPFVLRSNFSFVFTPAFFCFPAYFISFSSRFFFCLVWHCVWPLRSRAIVPPLDAFVFTSAFFCFPNMFSFFSERIFLVSHQSLYLIFPLTCYCFGRPPFFVSLPRQTIAANQAPGPAFVVLIYFNVFPGTTLDLHTAWHCSSPFKMAFCGKLMAVFRLPGAGTSSRFRHRVQEGEALSQQESPVAMVLQNSDKESCYEQRTRRPAERQLRSKLSRGRTALHALVCTREQWLWIFSADCARVSLFAVECFTAFGGLGLGTNEQRTRRPAERQTSSTKQAVPWRNGALHRGLYKRAMTVWLWIFSADCARVSLFAVQYFTAFWGLGLGINDLSTLEVCKLACASMLASCIFLWTSTRRVLGIFDFFVSLHGRFEIKYDLSQFVLSALILSK